MFEGAWSYLFSLVNAVSNKPQRMSEEVSQAVWEFHLVLEGLITQAYMSILLLGVLLCGLGLGAWRERDLSLRATSLERADLVEGCIASWRRNARSGVPFLDSGASDVAFDCGVQFTVAPESLTTLNTSTGLKLCRATVCDNELQVFVLRSSEAAIPDNATRIAVMHSQTSVISWDGLVFDAGAGACFDAHSPDGAIATISPDLLASRAGSDDLEFCETARAASLGETELRFARRSRCRERSVISMEDVSHTICADGTLTGCADGGDLDIFAPGSEMWTHIIIS